MVAAKKTNAVGDEAVADAMASPATVEPTTDTVAGQPIGNIDDAEVIIEEELDELAQARAEAAELRDKLMRLQAEWDNFRKRTAAERTAERSRATAHLIEKLLPVLDDMDRAIEHADSATESALLEGVAAINVKLNEILKREGCTVINPQGQPFDAMIHQAVGRVEDPSLPNETVTDVYQRGYEIGDRVLRPAMVVVSVGGPEQV